VSFEQGLFAYLSVYPGLNALVGTRIYPMLLPQQATFPAVTYTRLATPRLHEFEASLLPHPTFQFDCWAIDTAAQSGYEIAKDVATQVVTALDIYRGAMGAYTVEASIVQSERDGYDADTGIRHVMVDVEIWVV